MCRRFANNAKPNQIKEEFRFWLDAKVNDKEKLERLLVP